MLPTAEVYCMNTCAAYTDTHMSLPYTATGSPLSGVANSNIGCRTVGTQEKYSPMLCRDKEIERAVQTKNVIVHVALRYDKYSVVYLDGRRRYAHTYARRHASAHARTRARNRARTHATAHARKHGRLRMLKRLRLIV
jgi:hypothetical protein